MTTDRREDSQPSVLLVEDTLVTVMQVQAALRTRPWSLQVSETGRDGLEMASRNPFHVILLDYLLPDINGIQVLAELRKRGVRTPVVAFTAHGDETVAARFMKEGAADYIDKAHMSPLRLVESLRAQIMAGLIERKLIQSKAPVPIRVPTPLLDRLVGKVAPPPDAAALGGAALGPLRVLVVDGTATHRQLSARYLRSEGWEVEEAESGAVGIELAAAREYDAILLDYLLPDMSGLDALRAIKSRGVISPVIAYTAHRDDRVARQFLEAGATDFLTREQATPLRMVMTVRNVHWLHRLRSGIRSKSVQGALKAWAV